MAAYQGPITTTASRCAPETARGKHVFEVAGYSLLKVLGAGKFIRSATFSVGGHDWCIRYYPNGDSADESKDYVSVFLELLSKTTDVMALYDLGLLNQGTGLSMVLMKPVTPSLFNSVNSAWGMNTFQKRSELEASPYLQDDSLVIECNIAVTMGTPVSKSKTYNIQVPPSDLSDHLGKLFESKEGADVKFNVNGEVFHAHKTVLAMRSPVFKAALYGPMSDNGKESIIVEDMQPAVFKALLRFIYTDSFSTMDDPDGDENEEMVKHLLVAADRYAMERMKLMCESILCKGLDVKSVATTLALADQHHCSKLKDACIQFINSSNRLDDLVASQGYEYLKRACPAVFVDIWEKSAKSRKI